MTAVTNRCVIQNIQYSIQFIFYLTEIYTYIYICFETISRYEVFSVGVAI